MQHMSSVQVLSSSQYTWYFVLTYYLQGAGATIGTPTSRWYYTLMQSGIFFTFSPHLVGAVGLTLITECTGMGSKQIKGKNKYTSFRILKETKSCPIKQFFRFNLVYHNHTKSTAIYGGKSTFSW